MVLDVGEGRGGVDHFIQGFNEIREQSGIRGAAPPKQITFLADMVAKALCPPPCLKGHMRRNISFFSASFIKVYVFETRKA